ncbi:MAG: tRNA (guanosine(37)-N1)-methyltransferase TrmD [Acidobacteriota bacterium]
MKFDVITIFPSLFNGFLKHGIIGKAIKKGIIEIELHNLRDFSMDKHKKVDDKPYGGKRGQILMLEPIYNALNSIPRKEKSIKILLSPQGNLLNHLEAVRYSGYDQIILLCGRYEGVDERVREYLIDEDVSVGDYVLSGGEIPAMVFIEAVSRLIPGVVGRQRSVNSDSFHKGLLDYPQYTTPREFKGWKVPEVLTSGNHKKISEWRLKKSLENTLKKRPELFKKIKLSNHEKKILKLIEEE